MNANQLLQAYRQFAAADAKNTEAFDLLNFPNLPEAPEMTAAARAGEVIYRRGNLRAALVEAQAAVEDTTCPEHIKAAYQLIIEAAR